MGTGWGLRLAGDGTDGIYDRVEYQYNRLGHAIWTKDQNGTIHEYAFDGVLRIEHAYEVRGMVASITSFDATTDASAGLRLESVRYPMSAAECLSSDQRVCQDRYIRRPVKHKIRLERSLVPTGVKLTHTQTSE